MSIYKIIYFILILIFWLGCTAKDDEQIPKDEDKIQQEFITTVNLTFVEIGNPSNSIYVKWNNPEGFGSEGLSVIQPSTVELKSQKRYLLNIELLDDSDPNDVVEVNKLIKESGPDHQLFFTGELVENHNLAITYDDEDTDGNPLGLETEALPLNPDSGSLIITLLHGLNKNTEAAKNGILEGTEGEVDLQLELNIIITSE